MAAHIENHPELLLPRMKMKVQRRSAELIPGMVIKRRDNSLVDSSDETRNDWWDARFISTFEDCWPLMFEKMTQHFEAINEGLRHEVAELRDELRALRKGQP
jgi:hypothetical protein